MKYLRNSTSSELVSISPTVLGRMTLKQFTNYYTFNYKYCISNFYINKLQYVSYINFLCYNYKKSNIIVIFYAIITFL